MSAVLADRVRASCAVHLRPVFSRGVWRTTERQVLAVWRDLGGDPRDYLDSQRGRVIGDVIFAEQRAIAAAMNGTLR